MIAKILAILALLALTAWACWPLQQVPAAEQARSQSPSPDAASIPALDRSAFAAPIWVEPAAPAPPPAPEPEPPAPKPPKIQFLGITSEDGRLCALIFDEAADRIGTFHEGDAVAGCTISSITEKQLRVRDEANTFTFELKRPESKK